MSKRRLSSTPLPVAKLLRKMGAANVLSREVFNFDSVLSDELVLVIFSYLSWTDLCAIQPTNRYWARLATDNQLWKGQFMREYGRLRLQGSRGFISRRDGHGVKALPHAAKEADHIDWKWMFRISSNWRKGRCEIEQFRESHVSTSHSHSAACALLAGSLMVTTSPGHSPSPSVYLHHRGSLPHILKGKHKSNIPTHITALALDQSCPSSEPHHMRVGAFYETGEITIFLIDHNSPHRSRRLMSYFPATKSERTAPIRQAAFNFPLLVTLSQSFSLSTYDLSDGNIVHTQTLTSFSSFPPTSMVLTRRSNHYRLILVYSTPVYPAHWNAAVTVLTIFPARRPGSAEGLSSAEDVDSTGLDKPCTVISTHTMRSSDPPFGWLDEKALQRMQEQWARKVSKVADTQTDGKWVVLAPADPPPRSSDAHSSQVSMGTTSCALQLYRLHLSSSHETPSSSSGGSSSALRMTFVRMLYGHTGPVVALSLTDGRCVSLGADGSVWVWDLEREWGAEVQAPRRSIYTEKRSDEVVERTGIVSWDSDVLSMGMPVGSVVFDERRIVTSDGYGIEARRFDI